VHRWEPPDRSEPWLGTLNPFAPRPWLESAPSIPGENATEAEVAVFLDVLAANQSPRFDLRLSTARELANLASLVPKWLPLFIEAVSCYGDSRKLLRNALIAGTPEERKDELLRRIPDEPRLAAVAVARGWQGEAKPFVFQAVRRLDHIPAGMEALCRSYRDPAFHPLMRRRFTADIPTVRYWESMPDLTPHLPAQLADARAWLLAAPRTSMEAGNALEALLYTGDSAALDVLLDSSRDNRWVWGIGPVHRWLRNRDGSLLFMRHEDWTEWIAESTSADYTFDAARRCFVRKPAGPNR
jgi:hypothetical protein